MWCVLFELWSIEGLKGVSVLKRRRATLCVVVVVAEIRVIIRLV